ncbi:DinB family protein [bacterium]|nr:DinB family protein [candidate division CSSED10-310 bacterium]
MNWTELLKKEIDDTYILTQKLIDLVLDNELGWKPATGDNWMTTGQLLMHITNSCGAAMKGFVTGDWGLPEGVKMEDIPDEEMLPKAEKMPSIKSVKEAKRLLDEDRQTSLKCLHEAGEERLCSEETTAPWDTTKMILGHRLLQMVQHLNQHKGQLFYYLKLMGKPVHTGHLWGM